MNGSKIIESLNWRYACKKFDSSKKISKEDWNILKQALILTPSSTGLQPWKFVSVTNSKLKEQLHPFAYNQAQIKDCSHLLVILARKDITEEYIDKYIKILKEKHIIMYSGSKDIGEMGEIKLEKFREMIMGFVLDKSLNKKAWSDEQCHIALGNILTIAALMKIDACPIKGFDPAKFDELLNIEDGYTSTLVCPFGYRSMDDKYAKYPKVRFTEEDLFIEIE